MTVLGSLIRPGRPALTAIGVGVVVLVTCGGLGAIAYDLMLAPEVRGPTRIPSDVHIVRLCPSIDMRVHEMQEHVREWEAVGEPSRRVDTGPCEEPTPSGVAQVHHCNVGARCDDGETAGLVDWVTSDGRVSSADIYLRGQHERQDPHVWHELGHAFGWGLALQPDGRDGHDEHVGRVMSPSAGWSWEGL